MIYRDEIIEEVWRNRELYAKQHHHNLHAIVADLQKRQQTPFSNLVDRRNRTKESITKCQRILNVTVSVLQKRKVIYCAIVKLLLV